MLSEALKQNVIEEGETKEEFTKRDERDERRDERKKERKKVRKKERICMKESYKDHL